MMRPRISLVLRQDTSTLKNLSLTKVPIAFFFLRIVHLTSLELHSLCRTILVARTQARWQTSSMRVAPESMTFLGRTCTLRRTRFPSSAFFSLIQDIKDPTDSIFLLCGLHFHEPRLCKQVWLCISFISPATHEHLKFNLRFRGFNDNFNRYRYYVTPMSWVIWHHHYSSIDSQFTATTSWHSATGYYGYLLEISSFF